MAVTVETLEKLERRITLLLRAERVIRIAVMALLLVSLAAITLIGVLT